MDGEPVQLWVYDLSGGMAALYSQMLLGRRLDAIYHTSIVVGGIEHYFGGGINTAVPGTTPFGTPMQKLAIGHTQLPEDVRAELLAELSERYTPESYSLFSNNCNDFSNDLAQLLVGHGIPSHITGLPNEVLQTPFGRMIAPLLSGLERQMRGMQQQAAVSVAAPAALPAAAASGTEEERATEAAAAAPAAAAPTEQPASAAAVDESALHSAELEIEAAVAAGMMAEAAAALHTRPGASGGAAAADAKLSTELAVAEEFGRLMQGGGLSEHEAQAKALEAVAHRSPAAAAAAPGGAAAGLAGPHLPEGPA